MRFGADLLVQTSERTLGKLSVGANQSPRPCVLLSFCHIHRLRLLFGLPNCMITIGIRRDLFPRTKRNQMSGNKLMPRGISSSGGGMAKKIFIRRKDWW